MAADLTTIGKVQAWIPGIDVTTALGLIKAISAQIQNWLSYEFAVQVYTRTFNGVGGARLMLPDYPVTAVSSVSIDGIAVPTSSSTTTAGYVFDEKTIYLRGYCFTRGIQNVLVSYTAGYASVPADVEQACIEWVNTTWGRIERDPSVIMMKAGASEIRWGHDAFLAGTRLIAPMPPAVFALLQPYARVYVA